MAATSSSNNLTLAVDPRVVERAREVARQQGTSLNALVRLYIEKLAGHRSGAELFAQLEQLWNEDSGRSERGYKFNRADAYEDRVRG